MNRLLLCFALFILVAHRALGADIVVYDDSSHNPPFDQACSFGGVPSDFNFANTAPVHGGSDSIRFIPEQYNAVSWCGNTTYSTSSYSAITFWVYLGSAAQGDTIDFVLSTQDTIHGAKSLNQIYGATIPVGAWTQLHTVFASAPLNYTGSFDHISLQDETGATNYDIFGNGFDTPTPSINVYFDDVVLQAAATVTYTVTAAAPGGNGSITPPSQVVAAGATASFTVTPNNGYHVTSVTGDHCTITQQAATTTWISNAITQNCAVTAAFAINSYTVTPSVNGGNGSISPNTPQLVTYNATKSFTLTPNTGYHIGSVGGTCGGSLSSSTYTTNAVTTNCTVIANFAINTYTVTPSAGSGGTLTPSTPQTVNYNATTNFTVSATVGYHVVSVTGCGGSLNTGTYTTGPITANCTVTATFALDSPPPACGLTDTPVTVDNMLSDQFSWCDSTGQPRTAVLAHNDQTGPAGSGTHGGELRQFTYKVGANTRTIGSPIRDHGGFGYIVSHSLTNIANCDDSDLGHAYTGTWTQVFKGRHHAIFRFQQNYPRHCTVDPPATAYAMPVTIDWIFSTGRDSPIWAVTYDVHSIPADVLADDSRAPYGTLNIDGSSGLYMDNDVAGVAWGDRYRYVTTNAAATADSTWDWSAVNTVPFTELWMQNVDASMGLVQTQTMSQQDAGGGRQPYGPGTYDVSSYWGKTSADGQGCPDGADDQQIGVAHKTPCIGYWPYQLVSFNYYSPANLGQTTNDAQITWGTQYGFLGQTAYALHDSTLPGGSTASGYPKKSYSVHVVLGTHGSVAAQRTQVEAVQTLALTATTGSVVTSGPAGVNRADTVTYSPAGYDHIYGALAFNAASNVLDANINVGSGTLKKPLIIVHNYTSAAYPTSLKLNGTALVMDTDYFPSLRGTANELWITLNQNLAGATNHLEINTASGAVAHWVDGYHVGYESGDLPTNQVNFSDITHLMIGAVLPNANGTLDTTFYIDAVNGPAWAQAAVTAAHNAGRKVILMIGGAGSIAGWRGAASAANLNTFVTNLSNAATAYAADGLDIDWEPITDNNATNSQITTDHTELANLITALHTARPDLLLTMPVGAYNPNYAPAVSEQSLFTTITPLLDQINLMSYGMAFDCPGCGWYSWFSSALADETGNTPLSVSSSIAYYQGLGVPNAKLGVGIGFYGLCYNNVSQPRQDLAALAPAGYIANGDDNVMTYAHIASAYIPNMTYSYDATAKAPWLAHAPAVGPEGCTYVTYEDATSIADKGTWASAQGLGGTIIWTLAKGHLGSGNDPLLDATHTAFP